MAEEQSNQEPETQHSLQQLPTDYYRQMALNISPLIDRERNMAKVLENVQGYIVQCLPSREYYSIFLEMINHFMQDPATHRYGALCYASLSIEGLPSSESASRLLQSTVDTLIDDHYYKRTPDVEVKRKTFSAMAHSLGDVFTKLIDISGELYECISNIYSAVIKNELELGRKLSKKSEERSTRKALMHHEEPLTDTALYDDIIEYILTRAQFRSDSLNQQNPNEYMNILADRLRGTRWFVIQDDHNNQLQVKKREAEFELSLRMASAEDIVSAQEYFTDAFRMFWTQKIFNFKYISIEKVRVTLQILAISSGLIFYLMGFVGLATIRWWEGLLVLLGMLLFSFTALTKKRFTAYYPTDISPEMQSILGKLTPILRRMPADHLKKLLKNQVYSPQNLSLLPLFSEFVRYIFNIMPERSSALIRGNELNEILDEIETDITRARHRAAMQEKSILPIS